MAGNATPHCAACERCRGRGWLPTHPDAFGPTDPCPDCSHATRNRVADWLFCEADAFRQAGSADDAYNNAFADGIERALDLLGYRRDS